MKHSEKSATPDSRVSHIALDHATTRIVDDWRRQQEHIPPRGEAVRELLRRGANKEAPIAT